MSSPSPHRPSSAPVINVEGSDDDGYAATPGAPHDDANATHPPLYRPLRRGWSHSHRKRRLQKPGVQWREQWNEEAFRGGRVLLLDYVSRDFTDDRRRRIFAHEFHAREQLANFYRADAPRRNPALRVIHVQNAPWAREFLLRKFNVDNRNELIGTSFGKWAAFPTPQRRGGKPMLYGKAFRNQRDPWRGISRCGFGMDYLRWFPPGRCPEQKDAYKLMELNGYDVKGDPAYLRDVYVQRISVYIQKHDGDLKEPTDPEVQNPYYNDTDDEEDYRRQKRKYSVQAEEAGLKDYVPILKSLDNGTTVIIFEDSTTGEASDCVIQARREVETRWRRLTFYLPKEELDEERLALECMNLVLSDVFKAMTTAWDSFLRKAAEHVSILEDKIYEHPADESRAPELWYIKNIFLKLERLVITHKDILRETNVYLKALFDDQPEGDWLGSTHEDYERVEHLVAEDLVKPTDALNDLLYKSVEIRDSRHSIRLSLSMWRLSWITFIFLPLTFVVGFFGMNVDTFSDDPSLKWFFISAVPLMLIVLGLWYVVKHMIARSRQDPLVRGTWEHLFHDLAVRHPAVWSRDGPRDYVRPKGRVARVKWALLKRWLAPAKTIAAGNYDNTVDGLGAWARLQRYLAIRWLPQIEVEDPLVVGNDGGAPGDLEDGILLMPSTSSRPLSRRPNGELPAVSEAVHIAAGVAIAEAEPAVATMRGLSPPPATRSRASRRQQRVGGRRRSRSAGGSAAAANRDGSLASSDGGGSSCMVTEEQIGSNSSEGDDYGDGDGAAAAGEGSGTRGGAVGQQQRRALAQPPSQHQTGGPIGAGTGGGGGGR